MRALILLVSLALLTAAVTAAGPPARAAGETPLSPSEFSDYAEGWTLRFERDGALWGNERFEPGGAVLWRFPDGRCIEGLWRPHGAQMCFLYKGDGEILCWRMLRDDKGIFARLLGDTPDAGMELRITGRDKAPPLCGGPGKAT
jgi:hypothetical protein